MKIMTSIDSLQASALSDSTECGVQSVDTCVQVTDLAGMPGEPLPYKLESDEVVVGALFVCFIFLLLALQRGAKSILPYLKNAVSTRCRLTLFDERTSSSSVSTVALSISATLSSAICLYHHYVASLFMEQANHVLVMASYFMFFALLITGKSLLYKFVNWVFFEREKNNQWKEVYWEFIAASGIVLFPTVVYVTFLDSSLQISDYLLLTILVIFKILLFYKLIRNFLTLFYGVSHLILYFCTLEILPDLIMWKWIEIFNNVFLNYSLF